MVSKRLIREPLERHPQCKTEEPVFEEAFDCHCGTTHYTTGSLGSLAVLLRTFRFFMEPLSSPTNQQSALWGTFKCVQCILHFKQRQALQLLLMRRIHMANRRCRFKPHTQSPHPTTDVQHSTLNGFSRGRGIITRRIKNVFIALGFIIDNSATAAHCFFSPLSFWGGWQMCR